MTDSWKEIIYRNYASNTNRIIKSHPTDNPKIITHLIDKYFPNNKTTRIADLGCGAGELLLALSQRGFSNILGVDISEEQVNLARMTGVENIVCQNLHDYLSEAEPHDFISMLDILEHFDKQEVVDILSAVHNALVDNGKILIRVPNAAGFLSQDICFGDFTHQTVFTQESLMQVLRSINLKVLQCDNEPLVFERVRPFIRALLYRAAALPMCFIKKLQFGFKTRVIFTTNILVLATKINSCNVPPSATK